MDQFVFKTATVIGAANPHTWSQASKISQPDGDRIVLVTLTYDGESELVDLSEIGESFLDSVAQKTKLAQDDIATFTQDITADVVLIVCHGSSLTISGRGQTEVYLGRANKVGKVFVGTNEMITSEGMIDPGDVLLVTNTPTARIVGLDEIRATLAIGTSAIDKLAVKIHTHSDSSACALLVAEVAKPEEKSMSDVESVAKQHLPFGGVGKIADSLWEKLHFQRPLFIVPEKRTKNVWIGSILLMLLFVGILVGTVRRSQLLKEAEYLRVEKDVTQKIKEAQSIGDLNPERAKLLLKQGTEELDTYLARKVDPPYEKKAHDLQQNLQATETTVFKKQEVALTTLTELKLVKDNLKSDTFFLDTQGNIILPDMQADRVVGINSQDKSVFEIDTSSVGRIKELGFTPKKTYGLVGDGVAQIGKDSTSLVIQPDELWKDVTYLDVFAGNVYLLDKGQSEIWKYPALDTGFGTRKRWLAVGIEPDLSNVIDMKVDGDVWLLTNTGKLLRYSRGVPVPFTMEGFPPQVGDILDNPKAIYVTDNQVYVLEAGAQRVVVFDEGSGKYEKQYSAEGLGQGKDLVIYKDKGYVLMDDKIVWFQL